MIDRVLSQDRKKFAMIFPAHDVRIRTQGGVRAGSVIKIEEPQSGTVLFGPYLSLPAGEYRAVVGFQDVRGRAVMEVCCGKGLNILASGAIGGRKIEQSGMKASLRFSCRENAPDVEVRILCDGRFAGSITHVEILEDSSPVKLAGPDDTFEPYVVRNRHMGPITYDFWITGPEAEAWYGGQDHSMPEKMWSLSQIRPGMTVADCGAHHGALTVAFAKAVGPFGRVMAWEALPQNAAVVEKNLALNGLRNAIVRPVGLGDEHKQLPVQLGVFEGSTNTVVQWNGAQGPKTQIIEIAPLDDELPQEVRLDFIKIDVEGSDLQMIRGARKTLAVRPIIELELHNFLFEDKVKTLQEIFDLLAPLRYKYAILPTMSDPVEDLGETVNVEYVAQFFNPHIFCSPI